MDKDFLQSMCESYYTDMDLHNKQFWKEKSEGLSELKHHLVTIIESVKHEDIDLYKSLFEFNRQFQYGLIYRELDDFIKESFDDETPESDSINEDAGVVGLVTAVAAPFVALKMLKHTYAAYDRTLSAIANVTTKLLEVLKNSTVVNRVKTNILYSNFELCGAQCGVSGIGDLDRYIGFTMGKHTFSKDADAQCHCLTKCWADTTLKAVECVANNYRNCLQVNGIDINKIDITQLVSSGGIGHTLHIPLHKGCDIHLKSLQEHADAWSDFVTVMGKLEPETSTTYIQSYNRALERGFSVPKVEVKRIETNRTFTPKPFNQSR